MSEAKSNANWATIGKALTGILGAILSVIAIHNYFFVREIKIEVAADYSSFALPASYKQEFAKKTSISRADAEKWIEQVKTLNESERNDIGKAVEENALNVLKNVPKDIFKEIQGYKNEIWFYRYKIKNSGTKEVISIKIDFSSSGVTSGSKGVW